MNAVAAGNRRQDFDAAADDDSSRSARSIERFMPGKAGRRYDAVRQIDVISPCRLRYVDNEPQTVIPAKSLDAVQVEDIARHIRGMITDQPFGLRRQQPFHVIVSQPSCRTDSRNDGQFRP